MSKDNIVDFPKKKTIFVKTPFNPEEKGDGTFFVDDSMEIFTTILFDIVMDTIEANIKNSPSRMISLISLIAALEHEKKVMSSAL
jgi:hypothetical protein